MPCMGRNAADCMIAAHGIRGHDDYDEAEIPRNGSDTRGQIRALRPVTYLALRIDCDDPVPNQRLVHLFDRFVGGLLA